MATPLSPDSKTFKWSDHSASLMRAFRVLLASDEFVDVTLSCADARQFGAHKVVLSACSPYFRQLLKANPCQHPIVIMKDIDAEDVCSLLNFVYRGEVSVPQHRLDSFRRAAETLQIRGIADDENNTDEDHVLNVENDDNMESHIDGNNDGNLIANRNMSSPSPSDMDEDEENGEDMATTNSSRNISPAIKPSPPISLLSQALESGMAKSLFPLKVDNKEDNNGENKLPEHLQRHLATTLFPSGLEALYRQFPPFLNLAANVAGNTASPTHSNDSSNNNNGGNNGGNNKSGSSGMPSPKPSGGLQSHSGNSSTLSGKLDMLRVRATDPRPCPKCGKIYRSAHTLRTHMEDKHTVCPGYRCALCGTVAKSRNSLHSHMSRQHRGISTKDLPVLKMPAPFDPELASRLLLKAGVKVSPRELAARASPSAARRAANAAKAEQMLPKTPAFAMPSNMNNANNVSNINNLLRIKSEEQEGVEDLSCQRSNTQSKGNNNVFTEAIRRQEMFKEAPQHPLLAAGHAGMGSALLDTYLQMIASAGSEAAPLPALPGLPLPASRGAAEAAEESADKEETELGSDADVANSDEEESGNKGEEETEMAANTFPALATVSHAD